MKKILLLLITIGNIPCWGQTIVTNKGTDITNTGTAIYIKGDYIHQPKAAIANGGTIYITGNITNNSDSSLFVTRAGKVVMNGSQQQSVIGNTSVHFYDLEINKPANELLLNQNIQVNKNLLLSKGNVALNGYVINLDTAGVLTGETESNRVYGKSGLIRATRFIDSSRARIAINQAGIGFYVSSKEQFGYVIIERGHQQQAYNGDTSIYRYFSFQPLTATKTGLIDTLKIAYLTSESVQGEKDYKIYAQPDFESEWRNKGGQVDIVNHYVLSTTISPPEIGKARFSVFPIENNATCLPNDPNYISAVFLVSTYVFAGDSTHIIQLTSPEPSYYNWNLGDGNLSEEFSPYHIYQLENNDTTKYQIAMTVSNGLCSDTRKKYITVSPKPAQKSQQELFAGFESLNVYPNPNSGIFNVEFKVNGDSDILIQVMDLQGKFIEQRTVKSSKAMEGFDLSNYEAGMYYIKLQANEQMKVVKMVKF